MKKISKAEIRKLKQIKVDTFDAYTVSDEGFFKWFVRMIQGIDSTNRLKLRLTLLGLVDELRTASGRVGKRKKDIYGEIT